MFSSIEVPTKTPNSLLKHQLLDNLLKPLCISSKKFEFVKIIGKIHNIVQNQCFLNLKCSKCGSLNDLVQNKE